MFGNIRKAVVAGGLAAVLVTTAAAQVIHFPGPSASLEARWDWARDTAAREGKAGGYWIGYSIKIWMEAGSCMGSTGTYVFHTRRSSLHFMRGVPLGELVYGAAFEPAGVSDEESIRRAAREALSEREGTARSRPRVERDLAFLFHFGGAGSQLPDQVRFSNLEVPFDAEGQPLIWVDKAGDIESLTLVSDIFQRVKDLKTGKRLVRAAALHAGSDRVVSFLEKILQSRQPDELRARAASCLGDHHTGRSLALLRRAAESDRSLDVRKRAVSGLEDLGSPEAAEVLISLARRGEPREIRKRAVSALGDIASDRAEAALEGMVYAADDAEIQKRAVYALEDLPDRRGIPCLIRIAETHPSLKVRKAAIYSLGDSDDPRAREALIEIIRRR